MPRAAFLEHRQQHSAHETVERIVIGWIVSGGGEQRVRYRLAVDNVERADRLAHRLDRRSEPSGWLRQSHLGSPRRPWAAVGKHLRGALRRVAHGLGHGFRPRRENTEVFRLEYVRGCLGRGWAR